MQENKQASRPGSSSSNSYGQGGPRHNAPRPVTPLAPVVPVKAAPKAPITSEPKFKTKVALPEVKDLLRAGVQFGHEVRKRNPKMENFIFGKKNNINIIDIAKSLPMLEEAGNFLSNALAEGPIVFVGTKRQAAEIVTEAAVKSGAYFVTNRWAGGLMTNFELIKKSLDKLVDHEKQFEEGVTNRTKYEVALMQKEWERLNRLYGGIKSLRVRPVAVFIVDPTYETNVVRECNMLGIPVVAIVDSNGDPTRIDYPIPANDDAINSIKLMVNYMVQRLAEVPSEHRVDHKFKDYSKFDVQIKKVAIAAPVVNAADSTNSASKTIKVGTPQFAGSQTHRPVRAVAPVAAPVAPAAKPAKAGEKTAAGKAKKEEKAPAAKKVTKKDAVEAESKGILGKFQAEKNTKVVAK